MFKIGYYALAALLVVAPAISGCTPKQDVSFQTVPVKKAKLVLPTVDQIVQDPLKYYVLSKNAPPGQKGSIEYFWQEMDKQGLRKPIKISTEDFKREVPVEDRCPTKIWQEWDKTLTLNQVKRGVWKDNHVIGNVICEF